MSKYSLGEFFLDGPLAEESYGVIFGAVLPGRENVPHFTDPINAPPGSKVVVRLESCFVSMELYADRHALQVGTVPTK